MNKEYRRALIIGGVMNALAYLYVLQTSGANLFNWCVLAVGTIGAL